jgi:hypothetical protein
MQSLMLATGIGRNFSMKALATWRCRLRIWRPIMTGFLLAGVGRRCANVL